MERSPKVRNRHVRAKLLSIVLAATVFAAPVNTAQAAADSFTAPSVTDDDILQTSPEEGEEAGEEIVSEPLEEAAQVSETEDDEASSTSSEEGDGESGEEEDDIDSEGTLADDVLEDDLAETDAAEAAATAETNIKGIEKEPASSLTSNNAASPESDFTVKVADNKVTITKYKGAGGEVVIPNTIGGVAVTAIAANAFYENDTITSVTLPDGLESIGEYAFYKCSNIETINFNEGLKTTEKYSFGRCTSLKEIELPDTMIKLGDQVFGHCTSITRVYIPKSVEDVDLGPFSGCSELRTVEFQEGIERIPGCKEAHFYDKKGLLGGSGIEEIVIPDTVKEIGANAFYDCKKLKSVTFGTGLLTIEGTAFRNCESLEKVILPEGIKSLKEAAFENCSAITEVFLPASLENCGDAVFKGTTSLKKIIFEEGTTKIFGSNPIYREAGMFEDCGVEEITLPSSVTEIEGCAFGKCKKLRSIDLSENITSIGEKAFYGCSSLETIELPVGISKIDHHTFYGCSSINNVDIPSNVASIGDWAFYGCSSLEAVYYPKSVSKIGKYAYENCTSLTEIEFETHNLYTTTQTLGEGVFKGCSSLTAVQLGNRITKVPKEAFAGCTSLKEIQIPHGVTTIPAGAFAKCHNLEILFVPASVTTFETAENEFERSYSHVPLVYVEKGDATTAGVTATSMGWNVETGIWNIDFSDPSHNEFPDKNFNNQLYEKRVDQNIDTRLTLREIEALNSFDLSSLEIKDIKGLELLTSLEELDISNNALTTLEVTDIPVTDASEAYFAIAPLKGLRTFDCSYNQLSYLDMSSNTALLEFNCENNAIAALDLSANTSLNNVTLGMQSGSGEITSDGYFDYLLDLKTPYKGQYNGAAVKDITDEYLMEGEEAKAEDEGIVWEAAYHIPDAMSYKYMVTYGGGATATMNVDIVLSNAGVEITDPVLDKVYPDANFKTALFAKLDANGNKRLSRTEERMAKVLDVKSREIGDITGIDRLWSLETLDISHNNISEINLEANTELKDLNCEHNKISNLKLEKNTKLKTLVAGSNALACIDNSFADKLDKLRLGSQEITLKGILEAGFRTIDMTAYDSSFNKEYVDKVKAYKEDGTELEDEVMLTESGFELPYDAVKLEYTWKTAKGDMKVAATISTEDDPEPPVYVDRVTLNVSSLSLKEKNTYSLRAEVSPLDADVTDVVLASSDPEVVSVNGMEITALKAGSAVITATALGVKKDTTVSATCVVTVRGSEVEPEDEETKPEEIRFWIGGIQDSYTYTAAVIKPSFRLYYGDTRLTEGCDYSVVYKNNKAVKTSDTDTSKLLENVSELVNKKDPYVKITLKGNYKGTIIKTFSIDKKPISAEDITVVDAVGTYTGKVQKLKPQLYWNGKAVPAKEYVLTGDDWNPRGYKDEGTYEVTVVAAENGSFSGETTAQVIIRPEDKSLVNLAKCTYVITTDKAALIYDGKEKTPEFTVKNGKTEAGLALSKDGESGDYRIVYENNVNVGTATARFIALPGSEKCYGTRNVTFKITKPAKIDIAEETLDIAVTLIDGQGNSENEFVYVKGGVMPKLQISVSVEGEDKPRHLVENKDYKLSYKRNKAVGSAYGENPPVIIVTGQGDYKGKRYVPFTINPQDISKLNLVVDDIILDAKAKQKPYAYQKTTWTLTDTDGKTLKMGTDYVNVKKGSAASHDSGVYKAGDVTLDAGAVVTLTLTAKGSNYTGKVSASYRVIEKTRSIKKAVVTLKKSANKKLVYTDAAPISLDESDIEVRMSKTSMPLPKDCYEIVSFTGNGAAGSKAKLTIRGRNGYGNMKTITVTIKPLSE